MNTIHPELTIPAAILELADVTASEKLLLALYATDGLAKNRRALNVLSVGASGLKKIKHRLISKGLLSSTGKCWRVLVPGLSTETEPEGGHFVAELEATEKKNKVAPMATTKSWEQIIQDYYRTMGMLLNQPGGTNTCTLLRVTEATLREIQSDIPDGPLKDRLVKDFTTRCDAFYAARYASQNLPRKHHKEADRLIGNASPEQLAKLRMRIEQNQLAGMKPALLLQQFTTGPAGFQAS